MDSSRPRKPFGNKLGGAVASAKRQKAASQLKSQLKGQLKSQFKHQLSNWTSLFLSSGCAVCDRPTSHPFCLDCERQLPITDPAIETGSVQSWYQDATHSLPISALGVYGGTLKRAILAMKYNRRPEVADVLGHRLGQQWSQTQLSSTSPLVAPSLVYAIPIPLHRQRQSQRGYNQAELIARAFCKTSGLPLLVEGLARTQATLPQHQLSLNERQQNLAEAFQPGKALQRICRATQSTTASTPRPAAVIIDDIYTTGTTARSAAKTLTEAGMPVVGILAIARAVL